MATPKQEKLIKLLLENLGKTKESKSLYSLMLEAGYSEAMAKNPYQALGGKAVKEGLSDFVKMLDDKRRMAVTQITDTKLADASARDAAYIADILTKNHQLLSGEDTERQGIKINVVDTFAD